MILSHEDKSKTHQLKHELVEKQAKRQLLVKNNTTTTANENLCRKSVRKMKERADENFFFVFCSKRRLSARKILPRQISSKQLDFIL